MLTALVVATLLSAGPIQVEMQVTPDAGTVAPQPPKLLTDRRDELKVRAADMAGVFTKGTKFKVTVKQILYATGEVTAALDRAIVIWEVKRPNGTSDYSALIFVWTEGQWKVFPEDFETE